MTDTQTNDTTVKAEEVAAPTIVVEETEVEVAPEEVTAPVVAEVSPEVTA